MKDDDLAPYRQGKKKRLSPWLLLLLLVPASCWHALNTDSVDVEDFIARMQILLMVLLFGVFIMLVIINSKLKGP